MKIAIALVAVATLSAQWGVIRLFRMTPRLLLRWGAGLAALFFYAFNPVILANVPLVTADFAGALFVVLCLHAASRACEESPPRAWRRRRTKEL